MTPEQERSTLAAILAASMTPGKLIDWMAVADAVLAAGFRNAPPPPLYQNAAGHIWAGYNPPAGYMQVLDDGSLLVSTQPNGDQVVVTRGFTTMSPTGSKCDGGDTCTASEHEKYCWAADDETWLR